MFGICWETSQRMPWPSLTSKAMKQTANSGQKGACRQNLNQIGQEMTEIPQKGCQGLCLAFDIKGHRTNCQQWPKCYLQAKFEPNQARSGLDTINGRCSLCLAFDFEGHGTKHPFQSACSLHTPYKLFARMDRIVQSTSIWWLITVHSQGQSVKRFLEARGRAFKGRNSKKQPYHVDQCEKLKDSHRSVTPKGWIGRGVQLH